MKLGNYKNIHIKKPLIRISEKQIEQVLKKKQQHNSLVSTVDTREIQTGDRITIDFQVSSGKSFRNVSLTVGDNRFLTGFETIFLGHRTGDTFSQELTFSSDYPNSSYAGKKLLFHIHIIRHGILELPPLDDEFAKDVSSYSTIQELRDSIAEQLRELKEEECAEQLEETLLEAILKNSDIPVDTELKELITQELFEDFLYEIRACHMDFSEYCRKTGQTEQALLEKYEVEAISILQRETLLYEIARLEHINVAEEEFASALSELNTDPLTEEDLISVRESILLQKTMDFLLSHAIYD